MEAEGDHLAFALFLEENGRSFLGRVVVALAVEVDVEGVGLAAAVLLAFDPLLDFAEAGDSERCLFRLCFGLVAFLPHPQVELAAELPLLGRSLRQDIAVYVVVADCALVAGHAGLPGLVLPPCLVRALAGAEALVLRRKRPLRGVSGVCERPQRCLVKGLAVVVPELSYFDFEGVFVPGLEGEGIGVAVRLLPRLL